MLSLKVFRSSYRKPSQGLSSLFQQISCFLRSLSPFRDPAIVVCTRWTRAARLRHRSQRDNVPDFTIPDPLPPVEFANFPSQPSHRLGPVEKSVISGYWLDELGVLAAETSTLSIFTDSKSVPQHNEGFRGLRKPCLLSSQYTRQRMYAEPSIEKT